MISHRRKAHGLTQEQLAERLHKTTEHVSFLERAERAPSFDMILDLAAVFGVPVASLMSIDLPDVSSVELQDQPANLTQVEAAFESLREMQRLALAYGMTDILEDNNAKLLYVLVLLELQRVPGDTGSAAVDADSNRYELRVVTRTEGKPLSISTHRQLTQEILQRYRRVTAWIIAVYEGIELRVIYRVAPALLEPLFESWDGVIVERGPLNNPKLPLGVVKQGEVVYSNPRLPNQ